MSWVNFSIDRMVLEHFFFYLRLLTWHGFSHFSRSLAFMKLNAFFRAKNSKIHRVQRTWDLPLTEQTHTDVNKYDCWWFYILPTLLWEKCRSIDGTRSFCPLNYALIEYPLCVHFCHVNESGRDHVAVAPFNDKLAEPMCQRTSSHVAREIEGYATRSHTIELRWHLFRIRLVPIFEFTIFGSKNRSSMENLIASALEHIFGYRVP